MTEPRPAVPVEPPEPAGFFAAASDAPQELRPVVVLLMLNLTVSIILTVATLLTRHSIVNYQLDHRHITDPAQRRTLRDSYTALIGCIGIVGLVILQFSPYPTWMRIEQLLQAVILAALLWFVLRPEVRAHFATGLPGRDRRRFGR